jgi:hypothetical protein
MPIVENAGSNARDFCMLERNLLAALKLACLLCLLFASILLRGRLTSDEESPDRQPAGAEMSIASLHFAAAVVVIGGGIFESVAAGSMALTALTVRYSQGISQVCVIFAAQGLF